MGTIWEFKEPDRTAEITNDEVHLTMVSIFNGLCHLVTAMSAQGLLSEERLLLLHGAMTTPLDDVDHRDQIGIFDTRTILEEVLSEALALARKGLQAG